jgi:hypothetical protein
MIACRQAEAKEMRVPRWDQAAAQAEIAELLAEVPALRNENHFTAAHTRWGLRTLHFLEVVFGLS